LHLRVALLERRNGAGQCRQQLLEFALKLQRQSVVKLLGTPKEAIEPLTRLPNRRLQRSSFSRRPRCW
jgi:hypothetical protein